MSKFNKIIFLVVMLLTAYSWGIFTVSFEIFPYQLITNMKHLLMQQQLEEGNDLIVKEQSSVLLSSQIEEEMVDLVKSRIQSAIANPVSRRQQLRQAVLINDYDLDYLEGYEKEKFYKKYIHDNSQISLDAIEVIRIKQYGLTHFGVCIKTSITPQRNLLVYNQGHGGNPFKYRYFSKMAELSAARGYDVLALSMSARGFNKNKLITLPTHNGLMEFRHNDHILFSLFHDQENPQLTGVAPMLSGNYHLIQHLIKENGYKHVVMAGISGGGWYTTLLAALMPEIERSASFAGTVPLGLMISYPNAGDYEQVADRIYHEFDYWDFYVLATMDETGRSIRRHWQIYNSHDPCCYRGETAKVIAEVLDKAGGIPNMQVKVVDSELHAPDLKIIKRELLEVDS